MKLTRLNCGIIANTPGEITLAIKELMKNDAHSLQSMRKAAMAQAQPDAAFRIAELAVQLAAEKGRALTTG